MVVYALSRPYKALGRPGGICPLLREALSICFKAR
jgi:hypothetical protein